MSQRALHPRQAWIILAALVLFAACGSASTTPSSTVAMPPGVTPAAIASGGPPVSTTASSASTASTPSKETTSPAPAPTGFPFSAGDIVAFYQSQGYVCTAQKPSTTAVGYFFRTCQKIDTAGRTLVIGVVTDPRGDLGDGFASVQGTASESFLAPVDALPPLAGFLGVMLGDQGGTMALSWLAGHLGDTYSETTLGSIHIATYTASPDDHSRLYVEVGNKAYLDASPAPSA